MTKPTGGWDRPAIIAELHRRGLTLTGLAIDAGLYPAACRQGIIGTSRKGAQVIADALDVPFNDLFPTLYLRGRAHRDAANRNDSRDGSAKRSPSADTTRGAA